MAAVTDTQWTFSLRDSTCQNDIALVTGSKTTYIYLIHWNSLKVCLFIAWTLSVSAVVYSSLCVRLQLSLFRWKEYALKCTHLFQNTITPLSFPEKTALQSFHHPLTDCVIHLFLWSRARRALTHSPTVCMQSVSNFYWEALRQSTTVVPTNTQTLWRRCSLCSLFMVWTSSNLNPTQLPGAQCKFDLKESCKGQ